MQTVTPGDMKYLSDRQTDRQGEGQAHRGRDREREIEGQEVTHPDRQTPRLFPDIVSFILFIYLF